jgi:hypothetical protein
MMQQEVSRSGCPSFLRIFAYCKLCSSLGGDGDPVRHVRAATKSSAATVACSLQRYRAASVAEEGEEEGRQEVSRSCCPSFLHICAHCNLCSSFCGDGDAVCHVPAATNHRRRQSSALSFTTSRPWGCPPTLAAPPIIWCCVDRHRSSFSLVPSGKGQMLYAESSRASRRNRPE